MGIPERGSSSGLEIDIREGSTEEETLKVNLEGKCETVRKEIEVCRGKSTCKVMKF